MKTMTAGFGGPVRRRRGVRGAAATGGRVEDPRRRLDRRRAD